MTRYQPALDIWALDDTQRAALQPGQWVYAGERSNMGRFYGQGASTVVAWRGNWKGRFREYTKALRDYGRSVRNRR